MTAITYGADVYAVFENTFFDEYDHDKLYAYLMYKLKVPMHSESIRAELLNENIDIERYDRTLACRFILLAFPGSI